MPARHLPSNPLQDLVERASALHRAGHLAEAEALYRSALRVERRNPELLHRLGVCLLQSGRAGEAVKILLQALKLAPAQALLHLSVAEAQRADGAGEAAIASYQRCIRIDPANVMAHIGLGVSHEAAGRYEAAAAHYEDALARDPGNVDALAGRANCLLMTGRFEAAVPAFDLVLQRHPGHRTAMSNRGVALLQLERPQEALSAFDALLATNPDDAQAHSNRGNALHNLYRYDEALQAQAAAAARLPGFVPALVSGAVTLMALLRHEEAIEKLDRALAVDAGNAEAHLYRAMALLELGRHAEGWAEYEWRDDGFERALAARKRGAAPRGGPAPAARWTGRLALPAGTASNTGLAADIDGRTVVLTHEQGHGDTIQFLRFVPALRTRAARVIVQVQPALHALVARHGLADEVIASADPLPAHDRRAPLLSLPGALGIGAGDIPAPVVLRADPQRRAYWEGVLGAAGGQGAQARSLRPGGDDPQPPSGTSRPRVGLVWSGNVANTNQRRRSVPLAQLLAALPSHIDLVAWQPDVAASDRAALEVSSIQYLGDQIRDFDDVAALIELTDLVITIDSAAAHLAGSMRHPAWVLLSYAADWRWPAGVASPWYPDLTLIRQPVPGDWTDVLARLATALQARYPAPRFPGGPVVRQSFPSPFIERSHPADAAASQEHVP